MFGSIYFLKFDLVQVELGNFGPSQSNYDSNNIQSYSGFSCIANWVICDIKLSADHVISLSAEVHLRSLSGSNQIQIDKVIIEIMPLLGQKKGVLLFHHSSFK